MLKLAFVIGADATGKSYLYLAKTFSHDTMKE